MSVSFGHTGVSTGKRSFCSKGGIFAGRERLRRAVRCSVVPAIAPNQNSRDSLTLVLKEMIGVPMFVSERCSRRWWALAPLLCLAGCNKPQPNAPTQDFARRHQCPVSRVESTKEGADRMRVTGCGESESYVRSCETRGGALPPNDSHQPITEGEAHSALPHSPQSEQGCAWAREHAPAPPAGSGSQPKWLSVP